MKVGKDPSTLFLTLQFSSIKHTLFQERFQFIYVDAHGLGYLLDPRYVGHGIEIALREELEDFILKRNEDKAEETFCQLNAFHLWAQTQKEQNRFR